MLIYVIAYFIARDNLSSKSIGFARAVAGRARRYLAALLRLREIDENWIATAILYVLSRGSLTLRAPSGITVKLARKEFQQLILNYLLLRELAGAKRSQAFMRLALTPNIKETLEALSRALNYCKQLARLEDTSTMGALLDALLSGASGALEVVDSLAVALLLASRGAKVYVNERRGPDAVVVRAASGDVAALFRAKCLTYSVYETFGEMQYDIKEVLGDPRGRGVVDIGANVGDSAIFFALKGAGKVVAVEPIPNVARCAQENVRLNGLDDRIVILNAAIGAGDKVEVPCEVPLHTSGGFSTLATRGDCEVPSVKLAELTDKVGDPYVLKVDCEGCEVYLIRDQLDAVKRFEHVIVEFHPYLTNVKAGELVNVLEASGFRCRDLRRVGEVVTVYCHNRIYPANIKSGT